MTTTESTQGGRIFWGCFIALVTCAFGFIVRTQIIGEWQIEFGLSETEKGKILGVGFWPFAFSIIGFAFVIDKLGYGWVAFIGFCLHVSSTLMLYFANSYQMLYWGTFLFALSNGTVEAYINPAVAAMRKSEKTKWLNILHAGWPGGMVLAGVIAISMGNADWHTKVLITLLPTAVYAVLLIGTRFPQSERVAAGVTYREMLADFGALGMLIIAFLVTLQVMEGLLGIQSFGTVWGTAAGVGVGAAVLFGLYTRSLGQPIFLFLCLIMIPLATTELGTDSWITDLMGPAMGKVGLNAGWVLVYTALIMTVLRFCAGPIVHKLSPIGLLVLSALLAAVGLVFLSKAAGTVILLAATIYGIGKTFFWPTMLGVVSERFPRGGALTLNTIGGIGMLGMGVGGQMTGFVQDTQIEAEITAHDETNGTDYRSRYITIDKKSLFGGYRQADTSKLMDSINLYDHRLATAQQLAGGASDADVNAALADANTAAGKKQAALVKVAYERFGDEVKDKLGAGYDEKLSFLQSKGSIPDEPAYAKMSTEKRAFDDAGAVAKKQALMVIAILPAIMFACYLVLFFYFKAKGGYKPVELEGSLH